MARPHVPGRTGVLLGMAHRLLVEQVSLGATILATSFDVFCMATALGTVTRAPSTAILQTKETTGRLAALPLMAPARIGAGLATRALRSQSIEISFGSSHAYTDSQGCDDCR